MSVTFSDADFVKYYDELYKHSSNATKIVANRYTFQYNDIAKDVVQNVFIKFHNLLKSGYKIQSEQHLKGILHKKITFESLNYYTGKGKYSPKEKQFPHEELASLQDEKDSYEIDYDNKELLKSIYYDIDNYIVFERKKGIKEIDLENSEIQRKIIKLYFNGFSQSELAYLFNKTEGAIKNIIYRFRRDKLKFYKK